MLAWETYIVVSVEFMVSAYTPSTNSSADPHAFSMKAFTLETWYASLPFVLSLGFPTVPENGPDVSKFPVATANMVEE